MKLAVLSMDVEDWYHLDYFDRTRADRTYSMLDGLDAFGTWLDQHGIRGTFFVLGELATTLAAPLRQLASAGHEIASHGWDHRRPLTLPVDVFRQDIVRSKCVLEDSLGVAVNGYRAPCYSLDRERLDLVQSAGYAYDSSRIDFAAHPLYGTIDLTGYSRTSPWIFRQQDFFEFQVTTLPMRGKQVPISGGGYLRIFPWQLMQRWVRRHVASGELYLLYIHPFELSARANPPLPANTKWHHRLRFGLGRRTVMWKLAQLVGLLQDHGYELTTFAELRRRCLASDRAMFPAASASAATSSPSRTRRTA